VGRVADAPALGTDRATDLIARARAIRRQAGIGMDRMCRQLGIAKSTLSAWETRPPPGIGCHRSTWGTPEYWLAILAVLDDEQAGQLENGHAGLAVNPQASGRSGGVLTPGLLAWPPGQSRQDPGRGGRGLGGCGAG
jgi:hypothetical protein